MRPRGSHGEIAQALLSAATERPGAVMDLAQRAQVGAATARYTASRMVGRGDLVVLDGGRPAVLGIPPAGNSLADALQALHRSFWDRPAEAADDEAGPDSFACL